MDNTLPKKAYWPPAYILLQAVIFAVIALYYNRDFFEDDAYISLRFAKNLLAGNGLVWNAGVRLEGYTNFLLIMLTSALGWLGMDLVSANRVVEFSAFASIIAFMHCYMHRHAPQRSYAQSVAAALGLSLIISSIPLLAWCLGGLEGDLMAFFMLGSVCCALRIIDGKGDDQTAALLGIFFALAAMTRPESLIFFAFTGLFLCLPWLKKRVHFRHLALALVCFAILYAPYMGWRFWYFGEWIPNTYYAKEYHVAPAIIHRFGRMYLVSYIFAPPALPVLCAVMVAMCGRPTWTVAYLVSFILFFFAFIFSVGGDFMPYFRFMLPIIPVEALLIYHCGMQLIENRKELWLRNMSTIILVMMVLQFSLVEEDKPISRGALSGTVVAGYINEHWPHGSLIAINPAGALPYLDNDFQYIDMLGLNDKHIARISVDELTLQSQTVIGHLKGDGAYVLSRAPDYIIFGDVWGTQGPWFVSDVQMSKLPEFAKRYQRVEVYVTPPPALLGVLRKARDDSAKAVKEGWGRIEARGPVMDDQDRVRFIYYQRK